MEVVVEGQVFPHLSDLEGRVIVPALEMANVPNFVVQLHILHIKFEVQQRSHAEQQRVSEKLDVLFAMPIVYSSL
jgi:hypothetical protein